MKKTLHGFIAAIALLAMAVCPAKASHLTGQDFTYVFTDSSGGYYHYTVTLRLYQACLNGQPAALAEDNPAFFGLYTGAGVLVHADSVSYSAADSMPITATTPCAMGGTGVQLCINRKTFTFNYSLPLSTTGYSITYQRCCLTPTPVNIDSPNNTGISCAITIPPQGVATHNSSAVFANDPPFIIAVNTPFTFDCHTTDAHGHSLSYALCTASSGDLTLNTKPVPPAAPPFVPVGYLSPYSYGAP